MVSMHWPKQIRFMFETSILLHPPTQLSKFDFNFGMFLKQYGFQLSTTTLTHQSHDCLQGSDERAADQWQVEFSVKRCGFKLG